MQALNTSSTPGGAVRIRVRVRFSVWFRVGVRVRVKVTFLHRLAVP
jgi:hypothetical protein